MKIVRRTYRPKYTVQNPRISLRSQAPQTLYAKLYTLYTSLPCVAIGFKLWLLLDAVRGTLHIPFLYTTEFGTRPSFPNTVR